MNVILNCSRSWGIGRGGSLLFSIPKDMAFFRRMTTGKTVIMGDQTLRSLPGGRPLKNRDTLVMSLEPGFACEGVTVCRSLAELAGALETRRSEDVFVCGGAAIYRLLLPYCDTAYITVVDADPEADRFFPDLDETPGWSLCEASDPVEDNGCTLRFCTYRNASPKPLRPGDAD